jgi:hypothetical protein
MNYVNGMRSMLNGRALLAAGVLTLSFSAVAQKTGPSSAVPEDESLTWHGITLYGVIDVGLQYENHGAPYSDYRPATGNIVQKNSRESVFGVSPNNEGQTRVGLQGNEPLFGDWSGVFRLETPAVRPARQFAQIDHDQ